MINQTNYFIMIMNMQKTIEYPLWDPVQFFERNCDPIMKEY